MWISILFLIAATFRLSDTLTLSDILIVWGPTPGGDDDDVKSYTTDCECLFLLDRMYRTGEFLVTINISIQVSSLELQDMQAILKSANSYQVENTIVKGPGVVAVTFRIRHDVQRFEGTCQLVGDSKDTTTSSHSETFLSTLLKQVQTKSNEAFLEKYHTTGNIPDVATKPSLEHTSGKRIEITHTTRGKFNLNTKDDSYYSKKLTTSTTSVTDDSSTKFTTRYPSTLGDVAYDMPQVTDGPLSSSGDTSDGSKATETPRKSSTSLGDVVLDSSKETEMASWDISSTKMTLEPTATESTTCATTCRCNPNSDFSNDEIEKMVQDIVNELKVDKKETSKARYKKMSAPDSRPSSKFIGFIGIMFLCSTFGLIVLQDFEILVKFVKKSYLRECMTKTKSNKP